jgi:hypothetical protein
MLVRVAIGFPFCRNWKEDPHMRYKKDGVSLYVVNFRIPKVVSLGGPKKEEEITTKEHSRCGISVGSRTRDRSKVKPGLVRKDITSSGSDNLQQGKEDVFTNSDLPRGKTKKSSLLHLTSTE